MFGRILHWWLLKRLRFWMTACDALIWILERMERREEWLKRRAIAEGLIDWGA
jgi:hypothetical protein